jgi:DNA mismatch repair protein MutL
MAAGADRKARIERLVGEYINRERTHAPAAVQERLNLAPRWDTREPPPAPTADAGGFQDNFFQVHNSYIIIETEDGVSIIDQHALHERILYEEIRKRFKEKSMGSQRLLIPEVIELDASTRAALEENHGILEDFGFETEDFGGASISVSAVPLILEKAPPGELVREMLAELNEKPEEAELKGKPIDRLMKMMACKGAVKAGQKLSRGEIISLIERSAEMDGTFTCPHGRPTMISFTLAELEKRFQRK